MRRYQFGLLKKTTILFLIFGLVTLLVSGVATYRTQFRNYEVRMQERADVMGGYLAKRLQSEGEDFAFYQDYFMSHYDEMKVPVDLDNSEDAWYAFEELMIKYHPDKQLGINIDFNELEPAVQQAYATYYHEFFLLEFEQARDAFGLEYTYYVTPPSDDIRMTYVLDAVREPRKDNKDLINLGITVDEPLEDHQIMWEAWNTGETPTGYDTYDNEFGKTYAYYTPVYMGDRKMGVIGTEISIASFNAGILTSVLYQMTLQTIVMAVMIVLLLLSVNRFYIRRITNLADNVQEYAKNKKVDTATTINDSNIGRDEISYLYDRTAEMILSLDVYLHELADAKEQADTMETLATKDTLTGIRNKTAYDSSIKDIQHQIEDGDLEVGLAMIDLNFLKRINDTFGHEQGNIAIKTICMVICKTFTHSPVFRIGGDEFVVILKNEDLRNIDSLVEQFNTKIHAMATNDNLRPWEKVSAAIGIAIYDADIDESIESVFKRADKSMYEMKKTMHADRE